MLKRYTRPEEESHYDMEEDTDGEWVRFDDVKKILQEIPKIYRKHLFGESKD